MVIEYAWARFAGAVATSTTSRCEALGQLAPEGEGRVSGANPVQAGARLTLVICYKADALDNGV